MRNIRYFGQLVDPAVYRRGFGVWGWLLAAILNPIRMWLERRMVMIVFRIERKEAKLTEREALSLLVEQPTGGELPRIVRRLMRDKSPLGRAHEDERTNEGPMRPTPIGESALKSTFAQTAMRTDRSARYVTSRRFLNDTSDQIVAVPSNRRSRYMSKQNQPELPKTETQVDNGQAQPALTEAEIKSRMMQSDFATGANVRHLRVTGLRKPSK